MSRYIRLNRTVTVKQCLVYMILTGFVISIMLSGFTSISDTTSSSRLYKQMMSSYRNASIIERYKQRVDHLRKTCQYLQQRVGQIQYTDLDMKQQIFTMENTAVCVVPKSGCSFLKQLIYYLNDPSRLLQSKSESSPSQSHQSLKLAYIEKNQREIFNLSRWQIHYRLDFRPLQVSAKQFQTGGFKKVIVARNPYSRLYSAYIDKVYVPVFYKVFEAKYRLMTEKGMKPTMSQMCSEYVSFEDFLWIILSASRKSQGNMHWLPASVLCNACEVEPDIVIKQETYHEDVEYFLSQTNISETQWKTINSVIAKQGIQSDSILRGLIETMYFKGLESEIKCFSKIQIAHRVWEALKIQGQIYKYLEFPSVELLAAAELSPSTVATIFLFQMKKMPIRAEESKYQRQRAIARAYRHIKSELIIQIQALFYYDFKIFQYDFDPPK